MFKLFRRLGLQKDRGSEDVLKLIRIDQAMLNMLDKRYRIYRIRVRELAPYQQVLYGGTGALLRVTRGSREFSGAKKTNWTQALSSLDRLSIRKIESMLFLRQMKMGGSVR
ncbi:MAG: hypothetical protein R3B69_03400 [Candidatus Paceibacterota bacterium]